MSRFTAPLVVTPTPDYKGWMLIYGTKYGFEPFGYDIGEEGSGLQVNPPNEFETDFASIPWFARWLIPTWGRHTNAAVIHDYLYRGGEITQANPSPGKVYRAPYRITMPPTRALADRIMLEGMEVLGVAKWMRLAIYAGLRVGGWWAWRRHRR